MNKTPKNDNLAKEIMYRSGQKALKQKLLNPEVTEGDVQWAGIKRYGKAALTGVGVVLVPVAVVAAFIHGQNKKQPFEGNPQIDQNKIQQHDNTIQELGTFGDQIKSGDPFYDPNVINPGSVAPSLPQPQDANPQQGSAVTIHK